MSTTKNIAIGLGIASGALLAAWLFTGNRKKKTRDFISKKANDLKKTFTAAKHQRDDADVHYI
ncbi:MAG: hypothetical protein JNM57_09530 [Cyclobacteriaceae bacterium]|nr:hypothetical protein [Cyclobacteriaceae bacterium]